MSLDDVSGTVSDRPVDDRGPFQDRDVDQTPDMFDDVVQLPGHHPVRVNRSRDALLTPFGKATLDNRYLLEGESYQDLFGRVASYYGADAGHAQRLYDYISRHWFMPATPVLSNGGTTRGLPISCFLNEANDSLRGIVDLWNENVWLASKGGGIGSYWGNLRSIGENVGRNGKTSGVIPFIRVMDSLTLAISQGSLRRGSAAVYLPVWHPEIEEFIEIRRPTGGDPNRKALNLHHGVLVSDAFMRAVAEDAEWALLSPKDGAHVRKISARSLWIRILTARMEQGEPYIIYSDHVNNARPEHHKMAGLEVKTSNLCAEITLPTGMDHHGKERTAVCCLSSLNLETWDDWKDDPLFIQDVMLFLDNVLQDFIDRAPDDMERAKYAAARERSVGLGVMGFHSFLQAKEIPFESVIAKVWNKRIFKHIREQADAASRTLAELRGACPDAAEYGIMERFSNKLAIAPTASISIIAGNASPGIEPIAANVFLQKTLSGSFTVRNRHLLKLLIDKGRNTDEVWSSITLTKGSVQHLDFLTQQEKDVFKTAFELDQRWVVEHAADRAPFICQAQSINLFLPADVHKRDLHQIHYLAWKRGVKSLYYCRSLSIQRADTVSNILGKSDVMEQEGTPAAPASVPATSSSTDYDECLACQ
ncbi:ribonucleoside-diphosphate reductase subunit alpha [Gluconacetobacter azotocaptans]|uniref:Ribonucleoside-diphosphate reductase n=1 Tax=Gluconacetobacter azotocaptans TaxID=142834 RepID=A0A7W4JTP4_9PROT|nr:ribonucleoside-diphosphate reductase subunit alpha [Gluconacetobacter azotocaptans]MBB2190714.1 ribonucleoside-diphosphate reductase subunit alpha [Gluconacetobacter azotocaptans]MBM9400890.1 ribonucleoside-diphosphate reductase subunit alpha [Gluconacetobacter azotocaptans]GBQ30485.1 ribonucleotide-diphosphate reductase subunit alpha [Gluconacetobacter azotocaptans DSM 13594]